ncbi:MAG: bifunctional diaminohydroxyphosphoribosylaminopyrimidine deaminase/5-amino-6-(5-phosphoribosylamino)uracil reductase RibD [Bacteroidota bacterium]|nr:bifunctional diaminohydroxyphosphoribosylaminopyrimidine deaminase/5-amino-6-(5-phosphoribosylamino)uracil reductase RibD [Bacteroidota bacterium]
MKKDDAYWMSRCFELAVKGAGKVSPNPLVGSVIVKNGKKIGEGFHRQYGSHHAEINAITNVLEKKHDLTDATMYVNLEPCFHFGNTPPCVDAILRYKFARVVVATIDPNPLVAEKSIHKLRKNGIKCTIGILKNEAFALNEKFFTYIKKRRPFISIKAAQTADGFIARTDGSSKWITNIQARKVVHKLRVEYDAVLVGANTVVKDDPSLTVRHVDGRNPIRVLIDGNFNVPMNKRIFNSDASTIVYTARQTSMAAKEKILDLERIGVAVVQLSSKNGIFSMQSVIKDLWNHKISSVLVEGGQQMYNAFLHEELVDKIYLFTSKMKFSAGLKTFAKIPSKKNIVQRTKFGSDTLEILKLQ